MVSRPLLSLQTFAALARGIVVLVVSATFTWLPGAQRAWAQASIGPDEGQRIAEIRVRLMNPSPDKALNDRAIDQFRRGLAVYPDDHFYRTLVDFALNRATRAAGLASASYDIGFADTGGLTLTFDLRLGDSAAAGAPRGMLATGTTSDFPVLYDSGGTYVKVKAESIALHYGNADAWYGRPDLMLNGNPMVQGKPSGKGYQQWVEGMVHTGLYGITPLSERFYIFGGASVLASGSYGQELFSNRTRSHVAIEDAFAGFITGVTRENGDRLQLDASAGRQRFTLGDGFLIINTAANGRDRAALQANPRWSADMVALARLRYNNTKVELFRVDPDELPILDSKTVIDGVNIETRLSNGFEAAASFLRVPQSSFKYFTPAQTFTREGLQVFDARLRWQPNPAGTPGPFVAAEAALQRNENFDMQAYGFYGEAGWSFASLPWSPTFSYRYAQFSGDDPNTSTFERWDPLLSGGNGEQWVQGINHFKVVQDSNIIAHRFQLRLRPSAKFELVPQVWLFRADSLTNLGGNPALSFLGSKDYGYELNLTGKYFASRNVYVQGHVAATFPGAAVKKAFNADPDPWLSTMLFVRVAY